MTREFSFLYPVYTVSQSTEEITMTINLDQFAAADAMNSKDNAALIAAAPALLSLARQQQAEIERLRGALEGLLDNYYSEPRRAPYVTAAYAALKGQA